ncbi:MAG: DNA internalization-related competence protein ComEC/Rec2 [Bacilli bacterium]
MELAKVLLIKLKIVLRYRWLLILTVFHTIICVLSINIINVEYHSNTEYISNMNYKNEQYVYWTRSSIIYTNELFEVGELIKYKGKCIDNEQTNFIDFDYNKYLISNNIMCTLYQPDIDKKSSLNLFYKYKYKIKQMFLKNDARGFKNAVVFGDKAHINKKDYDIFINMGLSHVLALSGLHIATIIALVGFFINKFFKIKEYRNIAIVTIVSIYFLIINYSYSVVRTFAVYYCSIILDKFGIKLNRFTLLLIISNVILLFNKYAIYSYSFIFSFICYAIIILVRDKIDFIKIYIILQLIVLPITINLNNQINIFGFMLVPFLTLLFELIYLPYLLICVFFKVSDYFTPFFIKLINLLYIDSLNIIIKDLNIFTTLIYYYLVYTIIIKKMHSKILRIIFAVIIVLFPIAIKKPSIKIVFFDVGQGDATLIMLDNGVDILIDGGGNIYDKDRSADIARYIIIPYLKEQGIAKLDYIIASHGDIDHIGSFEYLTKNFKYDYLYTNCDKLSELETKIEAKPLTYLELTSKNYNIEFSCVPRDNENDSSVVTRALLMNKSFLSMGDMSLEYEKLYNENIDILKVSHHGSKTSTSKEFIENIRPRYAIISVGENNQYNHPSRDVLNNLLNSKVYRTDKDGAVEIVIGEDVIITKKK